MQSTTMLFVQDVEASSKWFQDFLGVTSGHGGPEFEMLFADDKLFLQLHLIGDDHHDHEVATTDPLGHGVVVVVYIDDAKSLYERACSLNLTVLAELKFNQTANMHEFVIRDPDGYSLMLCQTMWNADQ